MKRILTRSLLILLGGLAAFLFLFSSYNEYQRENIAEKVREEAMAYVPSENDWQTGNSNLRIVAYPSPPTKKSKQQEQKLMTKFFDFVTQIDYQQGFDSMLEFLGQAKEFILKCFTDNTDKFYFVPKANNT